MNSLTQPPDASLAAAQPNNHESANRLFAVALARAFGGAIIFSLPMLMTMEMWYLGFYINPFRLVLFILVGIPLLAGLSYYAGFEETFRWKDDVVDAFVAYAVGFISSGVILFLLAVLKPGMSLEEIIGKIALQALPAGIGATLAQSELGINKREQERKREHMPYAGEIFLMAVGALFLSLNLAPTEEMVLIAHQMTEWHAVALALLSIVIMHAFVYSLEFRGQAPIPPGTPYWSVFLRFTIVGYAVALLVSAYIMWTFEQTQGMTLEEIVMAVIVLAFPGAIGAAAARLIL